MPLILQALLFALGVAWCASMFPRWRDDLERLRPGHDATDRGVTVVLWLFTIAVAGACLWFAFGLAVPIVAFFRNLAGG